MTWHLGRMACYDLETTGVDPHRDRIVTAAVIKVGGGHRTVPRSWLVNPGIEIPQGAIDVHGITNEAARDGQDPAAAVVEIAGTLNLATNAGIPIVGHNLVYDITMLWAELIRHGHDDLAEKIAHLEPVVDTKIIEQHLDPYRPKEPKSWTKRPAETCGSHTLVDACRLWGIDLSDDDAHGAEADALASGRLAWTLASRPLTFARYDTRPLQRIDPASMTLAELHDWQIGQYVERAESYQSYRRGEQRTKPPEGVDVEFVASTEWPFQAPPQTWSPRDLPTAPEAVHA